MQTVIYADVLTAVNIYITYFIIVSSRVLLKAETKKYSVGIASVTGGLTSLCVLFEDINSALSFILKIVFAVIISYIAFLPKTLRSFFKSFITFFCVGTAFGGVFYLLQTTLHPKGIMLINGTVYLDVSPEFLVGATVSGYGCVLIFDKIFEKRLSRQSLFDIEIFYKDKKVKTKAFYDTGNKCRDCFDGRPAIFIEADTVKNLFTDEEQRFLKKCSLSTVPPDTIKNSIRVIPCGSVFGESIVYGILPSKVIIYDNNTHFETDFCICGIVNKSLSDGEYKAVLNCDIFERGKKTNEKN